MNTLLLAAGSSRAYVEAGHHWPKNLVEVGGRPLLQHVVESLGPLAQDGRLVGVLRDDEAEQHRTDRVLQLVEPTSRVVRVGNTRGAACSALMACEQLDASAPLVVAGGDALLRADLPAIVTSFEERDLDAGTVVFDAVHPRWSFVRVEDGLVVEASEKNPISRSATAGVYWFRTAGAFLAATMRMIEKGAAVDGQYYVCPVLNELVLDGARVGVSEVERSSYFSFRDPAELAVFEDSLAHGGAVR